jgi:hypothetical protein
MRRGRALVAAATLTVAAAACGSTVNVPTQRAVGGGLTAGSPTTGVAPGTDGVGSGATTDPGSATPGATTGGAGGATIASTQAPTATTTAAGGTVPTGPLSLGFLTTAVSNASAFGATLGSNLPERDVINALLGQMNKAAGLAGRKLVPVFSDTDTGGASWDAQFAAACAAFTEDHHVEAVLGYVFAQSDALEGCLTRKRIPHLSTTFGTPDAGAMARAPYLFNLASPTIERRSELKVDGAIDAGLLDRNSKLGIVMDGCPDTTTSWRDTVKPYIEGKGIPIATVFQLGCPRGSGDAAAEVGRVGNLVLQLRSANVDRVLFHAQSEGPAVFVVANAAEPQGYRPVYLVSSLAQTAVLGDQIPPAQRANVHGFGWMPLNDTKRPQWPAVTPAAARCLDLLKKGGIVPSTPVDFASAFFTCDAVFLFQEAFERTGGRTDGPSIAAAVEAIGSGHASVLTLDGRSRFGPGQHDGPVTARRFDYQPSCACFAYRPETRVIR